jgi:hypothetical protein
LMRSSSRRSPPRSVYCLALLQRPGGWMENCSIRYMTRRPMNTRSKTRSEKAG